MGFSVNVRGIRSIADYAAAQERYADIKPIRGSHDTRPLGKRQAQHMRIEKDGDVYHAALYRSRCVSYYPDGVIALSSGGYSTISTAVFIDAVSPFGAVNAQQLWIHTPAGDYAMPYREPLRIKHDDAGQWAVLNPEQLFKKSYNRVTTKKLRTHLKPLLDWMKITFALMADENGWISLGTATVWGQFKGYLQDPRIPEDPSHFFACVKAEQGGGKQPTAADIRAMTLKKLYQQAAHLDLCTTEELYTHTPVPLGERFRQRVL